MLQPFSREAMLPGSPEQSSAKTRRKHGLRTPRSTRPNHSLLRVLPPALPHTCVTSAIAR